MRNGKPETAGPALAVVGERAAEEFAARGVRVVRCGSVGEACRAAAAGTVSGVLLDPAAAASLAAGGGAAAAATDDAAATLLRLFPALTDRDLKVLSLLLSRKGAPASRAEIQMAAYGKEQLYRTRAVDTFVYRLRNRLGPFRRCVKSSRSRGYWWNPGAAPRRRFARVLAAIAPLFCAFLAAAGLWGLRTTTPEPSLPAEPEAPAAAAAAERRIDFGEPAARRVAFRVPDPGRVRALVSGDGVRWTEAGAADAAAGAFVVEAGPEVRSIRLVSADGSPLDLLGVDVGDPAGTADGGGRK